MNSDRESTRARRYLLGDTSEDDCSAIEREYFGDDAAMNQIAAAEEDLVEDYLAGRLAPDERRRFDRHYLMSPQHRRRVDVIRRLSAMADRPSSRWAAQWWGLAAAALLVLAAGGYLLADNLRLRHLMTESRATRAALEAREQQLQADLNQQRAADADMAKELARLQQSLTRLEARAPGDQQGRTPVIASFLLLPALRGPGDVSTASLPSETSDVRLQLKLESDDYPRYSVALKDPATNRILWRSAQLKPKAVGESKLVSITVPATLLKPQHYSLELTGVRTQSGVDFVASYAFKVMRE